MSDSFVLFWLCLSWLCLVKIPGEKPQGPTRETAIWRTQTQGCSVSSGLSLTEVNMWCVSEGRDASAPFFIGPLPLYDLCHWVSVPHMSHLTGSQSGCRCHGICPVEANETPPFLLPSSFQAGFTCWESSGGKHAMCVYLLAIEACAHACWGERDIKRENGLFSLQRK